MNLKSILQNATARFPDRTFLIMGDRSVTFARLDADSNRIARALIKMGVKKGDRVAMLQASNPEFVTVFFGILKAGAITVPLDSRYVADELNHIFADCRPAALFVEDPPLESLLPDLDGFGIRNIITFDGENDSRLISYRHLLEENDDSDVNVTIDPEDIAIISYTGGPTQKPHGVALSHRAVYIEVANSADVFQQTLDDTIMLFALPMYHQFGLTAVLLGSLYRGNRVVAVPGTGRSIDSFMEAVEKHRGTIYMGVPYIYSLMINVAHREGIRHDLSSLRLCVSGGAPLEARVIREFQEIYGLKIVDIYGQTENVSHMTVQPVDGSGKIGASGKPMPCWELKIFDENDNELPPDTEGEIVARGPLMTGFYNQPEATARTLRNGWLHTGDIGRIDKDGFLFITARSRRMLILKGQNIFPADIEEALATHPKIAAVRVVGVPDLVRGETVKALVVLKPGETASEQEIRKYCQGRMADYKLPREVEFVESLPETITGWRRPDWDKLS